jgi:hypothetical protein
MALLFSFSLAMDNFVIGRVVTAIDYPSIQFSIGLTVATTLTTRLSSLFMAVLSWLHSITRGCTAPRECAIGLSYRFAEIRITVSHVATNSFERGSVRRAD